MNRLNAMYKKDEKTNKKIRISKKSNEKID